MLLFSFRVGLCYFFQKVLFLDTFIKEAASHLRGWEPSSYRCLRTGDVASPVPTTQPGQSLESVWRGKKTWLVIGAPDWGLISRGTAPLLPCHFPAGISRSTLTFTLHSWVGSKRETFRGWLSLLLIIQENTVGIASGHPRVCIWPLYGVQFHLRPVLTSVVYKHLPELNDMWGAKQSALLSSIYREGHWSSKSESNMSTSRLWDTAAAENKKTSLYYLSFLSITGVLCVWVLPYLFLVDILN